MDCIRPEKRALIYALAMRLPLTVILEGGLAVAAYFACIISGLAVFLCTVIAIVMAVVLYLLVVRPLLICSSYSVIIKNNFIEVSYRAITKYRTVTPLHGKTTMKKSKFPFIDNLYKLTIENGGHKFIIKYLTIDDVNKAEGAIYERV